MKINHQNIASNFKHAMILLIIVQIMHLQNINAQVVSINGAFISLTNGTVANIDTIRNDNSGTLANAGTLNIASIINTATIQGNGTYNIRNLFTNTGTFTANSSTVHYNGSSNQNFPGLIYNNLTASGAATSKTALGNTVVNAALTMNSSVTIDMATYSLSGSLTSIAGTGILKTQNISSSPISSGKTWLGEVQYNGSSAQTIVYGNYTNLITSGGNRTIDNSSTVGIAGSFTPGAGIFTIANSTIDFNGSSAQTIPAFTFNHITVSGANTKTVGGAINVLGNLTLSANTTLSLASNNIKLRSTNTYTARVATIPSSASITYGSGRFIVERYVPGRRKYRLLTSSVTTSEAATLTSGHEALSIWGNWQNQGGNSPGNTGTIITGGSIGDGFDQQTTNASMFNYDEVNRRYVGFSTANGKNTKYTPLKAGVAYYFFVYGDRVNTVSTNSPNATVISTTGTLLTGEQVYNTGSSNPLTGVTGRYTMLGNPYASPINWATLVKTNLENTIWGWDPNLSSTGGYVTVNTSGAVTLIAPYSGSVGLNQYIQPGQGFFVRTSGASPELRIRETDKVDNFNPNAFRTTTPNSISLLAVNLFYNDGANNIIADGSLAAFDSSFSNKIGKEDASKIPGTAEGIGFSNGTDLLSIDARKLPSVNDTLFLNVSKLTKAQYSLQVFANKMENAGLQAYLVDKYLNTIQSLSLTDTNWIKFDVISSNAASSAAGRFNIVFKDLNGLAGTVNSFTATKKDSKVQIDWKVSNEIGISKYAVQRSIDGVTFTTLKEVEAKGGNTTSIYQLMDDAPASGKNYYRIKSIPLSGASLLSNIALVDMGNTQASISVFPNPVINNQLNIKFNTIAEANYTFVVLDLQGRSLERQLIVHQSGINYHHVVLKNRLAPGMYFLKVENQKSSYVFSVFVKE